MKKSFKITALFVAVLMFFFVTGCGDNAGGTLPEQQFVARETPLTLEAIAAGTITLTNPWSTLKYKKNGGDFVSVTASANTIAVAAGDKVEFYADGSENIYDSNTDEVTAFCIGCNSDCNVYGNVMSIISSSDFKNATTISTEYAFARLFYENTHIKNHATKNLVLPATTLADFCYWVMFDGCTGLTSTPALPATTLAVSCYGGMFYGCTGLTMMPVLPATTLSNWCYNSMFDGCTGLMSTPVLPATSLADYCYFQMFKDCTGLTTAPVLPAMTLKNGCYDGMFKGCTGLTSTPRLPATNLAVSCYYWMFKDCTGLTTAPALPATTLDINCYYGMFCGCTGLTSSPVLSATTLKLYCYYQMFKGCSSLNSVTCLATDISAYRCTYEWLDGVASSGAFTKAASMDDWSTNSDSINNGIPAGWTVQNYSAQ